MEQTTNLALPYIASSQNQKHITHNEALRMLDALVQLCVIDQDLSAPPDSPDEGARYIVADGATDAWAGWEGSVAAYQDGAWAEYQPAVGWIVWLEDEAKLICFDGESWVDLLSGSFDKIGVNATADETNRLAISSPASLFNHEGAGHQLKVNKATATDTNSLLFQTNWSGRAEMGCAGEDDWSIKVSADGSSWITGLKVASDTGLVTANNWVGNVSDSGLGAVVERGSNSNGEYVRLADGTQICTAKVSTSASAAVTWTYPASFATAADSIAVNAFATEALFGNTNSSGSSSAVNVNAWDLTGSRVATNVLISAFGRWF
nr:DUF2793 domain-containing protein [uncultured Cohaesibacter sp.]